MGGAAGFLAGGALTFLGAKKSAKATTQAAEIAANAQREATASSIAAEREMQEKALAAQQKALREQRTYMRPYGDIGTQALYQYLYRIGGGAPRADTYAAAFADPERTARISELRSKIASLGTPTQTVVQPAPTTYTGNFDPRILQLEEQLKRLGPSGGPDLNTPQRLLLTAQLSQLRNASAAQTPPASAATAASLTPGQQKELADAKAELARLEAEERAYNPGPFTPWNLEESPTYRLQMEDSAREIDRALRSRGLYGSSYGVSQQADSARRLAAAEQAAQLSRLVGLAQMGQEARSGMAAGGLSAANQMAQLYGQGAQNMMQAYQNQGAALGNAAMMTGAANASLYGKLADLGGALMQSSFMRPVYPSTIMITPATTWSSMPSSTKLADMRPGFGFMSMI